MRNIYLTSIILLIGLTATAQDIHFSQFNLAPQQLNPATAGAFNGNHRVHMNFKDQWATIDNAYQTYALGYDAGLFHGEWDNGFLGAGLYAYRDVAGTAQLGTTKISAQLAYHLNVSDASYLGVGVQAGFAQRSMNADMFQWDNQYDGTGYNSALSSNENLNLEPYNFLDYAAGIHWSYSQNATNMSSNDGFRISAGGAVHHLSRPDQSFYDIDPDALWNRFVGYVNTSIGINNSDLAIQPKVMYANQGGAQEIVAGAMLRYRVKEGSSYTGFISEAAISAGAYWRVGDAVAPAVFIEYGSFALGMSYDFNVSDLKAASNARGGFEIALRYISPNPFKNRGTPRFS